MAKKVLIIDDSSEDAKAVSGVFEKSGINVVHLNDAYDAMDVIYKEVPDLIVLDILMPDLGGYELCRMIKADELAKNIPVVMYSRLDKNIDKFWAFRSGANAFVNKGERSQELLNICVETIENNPVSLEIKGQLLSAKSQTDNSINTCTKEKLIKDFNLIKEIDAEGDILAVKILGTINRYFKYDCAMIAFSDKKENLPLFFDTGCISLNESVFEEIKQKVLIKNPSVNVVLQKEKTEDVSSLDKFFIKYEYEINAQQKIIGYLYLYAKNNLNSSELKLLATIKDLVEHIMRLRYFKLCNNENNSGANPKKLYTQLDFDRILSYECGWHKRNNAPLCLAFIEIESFDSMKNNYGSQYTDLLLAKISNFLSGCLGDGDFIYRNEDNIFAILMTNSNDKTAREKLEYLVGKIKDPASSIFDDEDIKVKAGALMLNDRYKSHYEYIDALYDVLDMARHSKNDILLK